MGLENYIHELLKENETVIVPGFGAFFTEYKPAEIGETEIMPPSKTISFSVSIRNNDGLLVGYVATVERVSHFDALKIIEKERDNIVFLLDKGEKVTLEGTGQLTINEKNEVIFTPVVDANFSIETFGLDPVFLEKLNEERQEDTISENNQLIEEQAPVVTEKPIEDEFVGSEVPAELIEEEITNSSEDEINEVSGEENPEQNEPYNQEVVSEPGDSEEKIEPVFATTEPMPEKENKKKAGWYWYLLILIPILVAGIFISNKVKERKPGSTESKSNIIQQNTPNEMQSASETETTSDTMQFTEEEALQADSVITATTAENAKIDTVSGQPVYYLVGGSFKEEENAKEYMEELKVKGFNPFYMGKRGNFYMIGVGKYKTEGQATSAREVFWESNPGAGLWVMKE